MDLQPGLLQPVEQPLPKRTLPSAFGSREEIAQRLAALRGADLSAGVALDAEELDDATPSISLEDELSWGDEGDARATLHTPLAPDLPGSLDPGVAAQLSGLVVYVHLRIRGLVQTVKVPSRTDHVTLEQRQWQNLVDLQARLAGYLKAIGEPEA